VVASYFKVIKILQSLENPPYIPQPRDLVMATNESHFDSFPALDTSDFPDDFLQVFTGSIGRVQSVNGKFSNRFISLAQILGASN
jgi:hypothetical protein